MHIIDLLSETAENNSALDNLTIDALTEQEEELRAQGMTSAEINVVLWLTASQKVLMARKAGEDFQTWQKLADATKSAIIDVTEEMAASNPRQGIKE